MAKQSAVLAPWRLFVQIVVLQLVYYVLGAVLVAFALLVLGLRFSWRYIFSWEYVRGDTELGWLLALLWLLDAMFSVLAMVVVVGRSKLATDFGLTLYGLNLLVVWAFSSFPRSWLWWALQFVSAGLTVYCGRWASQWRELRRTFFDEFELADIERDKHSQHQQQPQHQQESAKPLQPQQPQQQPQQPVAVPPAEQEPVPAGLGP